MPTVSVLTIVKGRRRQLRNQLLGLAQSETLPDELVIAAMDALAPNELPEVPFPVRIVSVGSDDRDAHALPLALARNTAGRAATSEVLVFLDVDCIPAADLLSVLAKAARETRGVVMGEVRYLPEGQPVSDFRVGDLFQHGVEHPDRPHVPQGTTVESPAYYLLWTLCIAVQKSVFDEVGGLDEAYVGYGAEDTDFALTLEQRGVPFHLVGATAFHQYHAVYRPPVTLAHDIARNSQRFYEKWGGWPMQGWLGELGALGLIAWQREGERLSFLRDPTETEVAAAYKNDGTGF